MVASNLLLLLFNQYTIPAAETAEGKERLQLYYEALGKFFDIFAQVEEAITRTLWYYAKTPPEIAKIIFAGAKIEISASHIRQLVRATGATTEAITELDDVLQQLGIINGARNNIAHYGATRIAEGQGTVSNALKAKGEPIEFPISPAALSEMTEDCRKIIFHLRSSHIGRPPLRGEIGLAVLRAPWRYKHPAQPQSQKTAGQPQPDHKPAPERSPPPEPSQA